MQPESDSEAGQVTEPERANETAEVKARDEGSGAPPTPSQGTRKDLQGSTLSFYVLHNPVGAGGMGTVYRATDTRTQREVAVKVLDKLHDPSRDPILRERFQREARLSMRLAHPNIVEVLDAGEHDGTSFIVMELLKGKTLSQLLEQERTLPMGRAVALFRKMCAGLSFAHELGLVHRDLKPANVMVTPSELAGGEEDVKLLDFGLAKPFVASGEDDVTRNNPMMGSPTYMAPELARNEANVEGDIYSLGVVLFRMLTGRVPFTGRSGIDVIVQHVQAPVPRFAEIAPEVRISDSLEAIVRRCLEKAPANRYSSVKALLGALAEAEHSPDAAAAISSLVIPRLRTRSPQQSARVATPVPLAPTPSTKAVTTEIRPPRLRVPTPLTSQPPPPPDEALAAQSHAVSRPLASREVLHAQESMPIFAAHVRKAPSPFRFAWVAVPMVLAFGVTWLVIKSETPKPEAVTVAPAPAPAPVEVAAKPATPALETVAPAPTVSNAAPNNAPVVFRINSIPIGATVKLSGKTMGLTPIAFEVAAEENGEATAELTLELRGYQALTFIATSSGPRFDLTQRLQKGSGRVTLAPVHTEPAAPTPPSVAAPVTLAAMPVAPTHEPQPKALSSSGVEGPPAINTPVTPAVAMPTPAVQQAPKVVASVVEPPAPAAPQPQTAAPAADGLVPLDQVSVRPRMVNPGLPPRYTPDAIAAKVEGTSVARCRVTIAGSLTGCHIVKSVPMLDEAVVKSLATRVYEPAKLAGQPVETEISVVTRLVVR